jgi:hypothetical protein
MNTSAKGRRNEYRSRALLESLGYQVLRSAASKGAWDLVALSTSDVVLVQCRSNRAPTPAEREVLAAFPCPSNCRKLLHTWRDHQRAPIVSEL